jgi:hypothetical protein
MFEPSLKSYTSPGIVMHGKTDSRERYKRRNCPEILRAVSPLIENPVL